VCVQRGQNGLLATIPEKYDELAETFTAREYGDPDRYFRRRARAVATLGRPLESGDRVLDLGAADASAAPSLLALGLEYTAVDFSPGMVAVASRRHGERIRIELADMFVYRPPEPVAATVCFRTLHLVRERARFFGHVAEFTEKKLMIDLDPRAVSLDDVRADLLGAGFDAVATRPFFVPQHVALPAPVAAALAVVEDTPPLARLVLRRRFNLLVAGYRRTRPGAAYTWAT
jgi:hypothetical protein